MIIALKCLQADLVRIAKLFKKEVPSEMCSFEKPENLIDILLII